MFHNNIMKISEKLKERNVLKKMPPSYLPYRFLRNLHIFLIWEKVKIFVFLKNNDQNKTFCA